MSMDCHHLVVAHCQLLRFIIFTFLVLFAEVVQSQRLIGIPNQPVKHVEFSASLSMRCSPESTSDAVDLKWYGPNEYRPADSEPYLILSRNEMPREENGLHSRIYAQQIGRNLDLFINNVESKDTGRYNCTGRVNNIPSYWTFELQAVVGLTVDAPPEQTLVFGETSKINCLVQAQPAPETLWYGEEFINPAEDDKYEQAADGLIVYNVVFEDAGDYTCTGKDSLGRTLQRIITVDVASRPVMTRAPVNTTGVRYRDATILCSATSIPVPHYKWYLGKDNPGDEVTSLENSDRFRPSSTNGDLTIVNVQDLDERWYWCEASNNAGPVQARAYFEVHIFPVFSDSVNLNKTETREGNVVEMICQCEAKPNPRMYFQRQGYPAPYVDGIQPNDNRILIYEKSSAVEVEGQTVIPQEVVIRINATTPNDTANYTCIAENSAGRNETTMHIIIQHEPNFDLTPQSMRTQCLWEDHPRNITVLLSGYPQPSLGWARGDGQSISSDEEAYKMYFEPYWNNGRPDEWMANLKINWEVTKGGLQGPYDPVGNYFPTASNNLGTKSFTINVVEGELPGRVRSVNVIAKTAQSITVSAEPPVEDNCIQANGFEILYSIHGTNDIQQSAFFPLEERHKMVLNDLEPGASYSIYVHARNERGRGATPASFIEDTLQSTAPEMVNVTSSEKSHSPVSHQVIWASPITGGEAIQEYVISWRKAGEKSWNFRSISTGSLWWTISDLEPGTDYELKVQARNKKGLSAEQDPPVTFYTVPDGSGPTGGPSMNYRELPLPIHYMVIIGVVSLLVLLVAIDLMCFCGNDCGILACICGNVGKKGNRNHGDIISLDGGESRSLTTSENEPVEKTSTPSKPVLSMTSSAYGGTATHGQHNAMCVKFGSQRSGERSEPLTTFASASDQDNSQPHEYVNTGKLSKTQSIPVPYERGNYQNNSRPVPQPRVPSQMTSFNSNPQNSAPGNSYGAAYQDRYGHPPPTYNDVSTNVYAPTSKPTGAALYTRPPQSRYRQYQPQNMDSSSQDYHAQSRTSPLPPGHRPTMI